MAAAPNLDGRQYTMAQVNMRQVKELRERTQAGLNDCRGALTEAEGDMEAAVALILKKGLAKSAKRAGALASEGVVSASVGEDSKSGVIVEVNIQTDFAARNEDFLAFVQDVVAVARGAAAGADLGAEPSPAGEPTLEDQRQKLVARLGENVAVRRWEKLSVSSGRVHSYVHMGGKIGVLLAVETEAPSDSPVLSEFLDNTAMQAAAMAPRFLDSESVTAGAKAEQMAIYKGQLQEEGKPEQAWPKIIEGKLAKWEKEACLLLQQSVLDSSKNIEQIRAEVESQLGTRLDVTGFVRFERGEGLEAPESPDFADEARRMAGQG